MKSPIDLLKFKSNYYVKLDSKNTPEVVYDYRGLKLTICKNDRAMIKKNKVNEYLDKIDKINQHFNVVGNIVELKAEYGKNDPSDTQGGENQWSVSGSTHILSFLVGDTREVDPEMPVDISQEIENYVSRTLGLEIVDATSHWGDSNYFTQLKSEGVRLLASKGVPYDTSKYSNLEDGFIKFYVII